MPAQKYVCTLDEPYSFSGFSYPRDAIFQELISGSSDALFLSAVSGLTHAVLVEGGGSQMHGHR